MKRVSIIKQRRSGWKKVQNFDVVIVGAGSGGAGAALYAAKKGLQVVLIEEYKLGGTAIHCGGIQARMLQKHAKILYEIKKSSEWGFEISAFDLDYEKLRNRMQATTLAQTTKLYTLLQEAGVTYVIGTAKIDGNLCVHVAEETYTAPKLILATGSVPKIPEIPGLQQINYMTTDTIYQQDKLPKKLTIIGGGVTAVETAFSLAPLGTEITIIEENEDILMDEDPEIRYQLKKQLAQLNVIMLTNQQISAAYSDHIEIDDLEIQHEQIFLACGRQARTEIVNILALKKQQEGTILVNEFFQTTNPKVYAIGQVCDSKQFLKTTYLNGVSVIDHILKIAHMPKQELIVRSLNSFPEVAAFGLNESQALETYGENITLFKIPIQYSIDGLLEGDMKCILKLIVHSEFDEIIGAITIGEFANQVIEQIAIIVRLEGSLEEVLTYINFELSNNIEQRKIV